MGDEEKIEDSVQTIEQLPLDLSGYPEDLLDQLENF